MASGCLGRSLSMRKCASGQQPSASTSAEPRPTSPRGGAGPSSARSTAGPRVSPRRRSRPAPRTARRALLGPRLSPASLRLFPDSLGHRLRHSIHVLVHGLHEAAEVRNQGREDVCGGPVKGREARNADGVAHARRSPVPSSSTGAGLLNAGKVHTCTLRDVPACTARDHAT